MGFVLFLTLLFFSFLFCAPLFSCAAFLDARVFNSDLQNWKMNKEVITDSMFKDAKAFNQTWCSTNWIGKITVLDLEGSNGKLICCPPGNYFNATTQTCGKCQIGQYNDDSRVTDALPTTCVPCPRNTFGPIAGLSKCSPCKLNQYR